MNPELEDALNDARIFQRDMRAFRRTMFRYMSVFWLFVPYLFFAPAWNAVQGEGWSGFVILGVLILPWWLYGSWTIFRLRHVLEDLAAHDDEVERAKAAKRKILDVRAGRIERAEQRLERLKARQVEEERQAIVEDLDRLKDELDDQ